MIQLSLIESNFKVRVNLDHKIYKYFIKGYKKSATNCEFNNNKKIQTNFWLTKSLKEKKTSIA